MKEAGIDLQDLFKDVKLIRVVIIEANKNNRQALESGVKTLQKELDAKWTPIVQMDGGVNVYALGDAKGESTAGLALLMNDGDIIIANVVGHVPLAKILNIASKNNKGMLKTLNKTLKTMTSDEELETLNKTIKPLLSNTEQPAANKPKSTGSAPTNHPAAKEPASKP